MNWHKNKGFSLVEVLAGAALVGLWTASSLQLLQSGLSAIDKAYKKTLAVELLSTYQSDAHKAWASGSIPSLIVEMDSLLIQSEVNEIDPSNATVKVTVSWGEDNKLTQRFWLSR